MEDYRPTVFIVDDDNAVRKSLQTLVETIGLQVKTYSRAKDFLDEYDPLWSGCLVLDVRMPDLNGLGLQSLLLSRGMSIPIIFVSGYGDIPMAVKAIKRGAVTFLEKPFREQVLLDSIEKAIQLDLLERSRRAEKSDIEKKILTLTPREQEVMEHLMMGKPNKEIGHQLGISQKTVDFHRVNILEKMGINSVIELVLIMRGGNEWGTKASNNEMLDEVPTSSF